MEMRMIFKKVKESLDFDKQYILNSKIYNAVLDVLCDEKFLDVTETDVSNAFNEFNRRFFRESFSRKCGYSKKEK